MNDDVGEVGESATLVCRVEAAVPSAMAVPGEHVCRIQTEVGAHRDLPWSEVRYQ
ncbi:hypothetical protein [Pseudofrankia inefficax]|uniref:hypothetical protein n=1 Tax=Pseudofrankia inefficax (strain DSM 45817 / CECT 9037 / DDB 130130 / EuI1c) TaxID=298654 RepID=UPI0002D9DEF2|nr:hypothetical protein [Pseudofrankia inefficax]